MGALCLLFGGSWGRGLSRQLRAERLVVLAAERFGKGSGSVLARIVVMVHWADSFGL